VRACLLKESSNVADKADGVIDEELVEVTISEKGLNISLEVINEIDCVNSGIEALSKGIGVVLKASNETQRESLWVLGIDVETIDRPNWVYVDLVEVVCVH
jgi:hypothetical protein